MNEFGPSGWTDDGELYLVGKITHGEMNNRFVANLSGIKTEMQQLAKQKAVIREGFTDFYQQLKKKSIPLVVISGGWDLYVTAILESFDLHFVTSLAALSLSLENAQTLVPLISNKVVSDISPQKWQIESIWADASCQLSTPCKAIFARHLKQSGYTVISIGNSETDICMAEIADHVFATGSLTKHLEMEQIKYYPFSTFYEVSEVITRLDL